MSLVLTLLVCSVLFFLRNANFDGAPRLPETWANERERLVKENGGNDKSEEAVKRGLMWLVAQQVDDGSWSFDGVSQDKIAATALALLPFLAAGEMDFPIAGGGVHKGAHEKTVAKGIDWLSRQMDQDGRGFKGTDNMYSHAMATMALCEAAGRGKKPAVKAKAKQAIEYLLQAQGRNGSWGYTGKGPSEGDTSIAGWQIQALAAADWAGIPFDNREKVYERADKFLVSVSKDNGATYGYTVPGESKTLTPVGLLSRQTMGTMSPRHPAFHRGLDFVSKSPPLKDEFDTYYFYYATRAMFLRGGTSGTRFGTQRCVTC